jgi:sugar lactone lactonase YvrE
VTTVAGGAAAGDVDGPVATAQLANPVSVVIDLTGGLIVADFDNDKLRRIDLAAGTVSTLTKQSDFQRPYGMAFGADGALYVDTDYNPMGDKDVTSGTLWRVDAASGRAVVVAANIGRPRGVAATSDRRLVLGDYQNARVRQLVLGTDAVSDLVGDTCASGEDVRPFAVPYGVAIRPDGVAIVADQTASRLSAIAPGGTVSVFAGGGGVGSVDGAATAARFSQPKALAADGAGNVYVSEVGTHRIRRVSPDGTVMTVAGNGQAGFQDGPGAQASFYGQEGIAAAADGHTLYVADGTNGDDGSPPYNRIRKITIP